jgi:hypothetical protein
MKTKILAASNIPQEVNVNAVAAADDYDVTTNACKKHKTIWWATYHPQPTNLTSISKSHSTEF